MAVFNDPDAGLINDDDVELPHQASA